MVNNAKEMKGLFRRVLIPIDTRHDIDYLLNVVAKLAEIHRFKPVFLFIAKTERDPEIDRLRELLSRKFVGIDYELRVRVSNGRPEVVEILSELSEAEYDLVILYTHGHYGISALIYESKSLVIALASSTNVLILR